MREQFPPKRPGEAISANLLNKIAKGSRRALSVTPGSNQGGLNISGSGAGTYSEPAFMQVPLYVVSGINGIYSVRMRQYRNGGWEIDTSAGPFELDATDTDQTFVTGQKIHGYWHPVRGAFLPLGGGGSPQSSPTPSLAYADFRMLGNTNIGTTWVSPPSLGSWTPIIPLAWFSVEVSRNLAEGWGMANDLATAFSVPWSGYNTFPSEQYLGTDSGVGIHSFLAQSGLTYVRVGVNASGPDGTDVTLQSGFLRLKVQGLGDDVPIKGGPFADYRAGISQGIGAIYLAVSGGTESAANNEAPVDPDAATQPWITIESTAEFGDLVGVHVPYGLDSDGNKTSIAYIVSVEAEITVVAVQEEGESSQSGSVSSASSLSTSSSSRSSSSLSSQSVSSQSSASSASSISSQSSSSSSNSSSSSSFSTSSSSLSSKSSISTSSSSNSSSGAIR